MNTPDLLILEICIITQNHFCVSLLYASYNTTIFVTKNSVAVKS
nr:MAG TPA: hypothetical protein [Caudoviricetes sp.]